VVGGGDGRGLGAGHAVVLELGGVAEMEVGGCGVGLEGVLVAE